MQKSYRNSYIVSVIGLLILSAYPVYMGIRVVADNIANGSVDAADYPKYVIPYTPICIALIISTLLIPLAIRFLKRFALFAISALGVGLFFTSEIFFENIYILEGKTHYEIETWQMLSCIAQPSRIINNEFKAIAGYSPAFKIHFYIIAMVIILTLLSCIFEYIKMQKTQIFEKKKPLTVKFISVAVFIGLCIFACFTAFFRKGGLDISPVSAILMTVFFVVFGVTVGTYLTSALYRRKMLYSVIIPTAIAVLTTVIMYIGELILLGGKLYKFGRGFLFEPIFGTSFAMVDLGVILLSGVCAYFICININKNNSNKKA